jgi:hypothetical protein
MTEQIKFCKLNKFPDHGEMILSFIKNATLENLSIFNAKIQLNLKSANSRSEQY